MLNEKLAAGRRIVGHLLPSEDAIDGAILENTKLLASIVEGRMRARAAAADTDRVVASAIAAIGALGQARSHVVNCHANLATLRDQSGLSPVAVGCTIDKLGDKKPAGKLRAVGTA